MRGAGAGATGQQRGGWDCCRGAAMSLRCLQGSSQGQTTSRNGYKRLAISTPTEGDSGPSDLDKEDDEDNDDNNKDDGNDGNNKVNHLCALYHAISSGSFCPCARSFLLLPVPLGDGNEGDGNSNKGNNEDAWIGTGVLSQALALLGHVLANPDGAGFAQIIWQIQPRGAPPGNHVQQQQQLQWQSGIDGNNVGCRRNDRVSAVAAPESMSTVFKLYLAVAFLIA